MSFYLDRFVSARVIRTTYGVRCSTDYKPNDPEHAARALRKFICPSGRVVLPNGFSPILTKVRHKCMDVLGRWTDRISQGTRVREHQEISRSFCREAQARENKKLNNISTSITCYKGNLSDPQWMDVDSGTCSCRVFETVFSSRRYSPCSTQRCTRRFARYMRTRLRSRGPRGRARRGSTTCRLSTLSCNAV